VSIPSSEKVLFLFEPHPPSKAELEKFRAQEKLEKQNRSLANRMWEAWPTFRFFFPDVPGIYRPRHPELTVLYCVLFYYFEPFVTEYERRFQQEHGYFRPTVQFIKDRVPSWIPGFMSDPMALLSA
jgi:hypothetical protein